MEHRHRPMHEKHGSKLGKQEQADQPKVADIAQKYIDEIKAGRMKIEGVSEIDLGGGKYVRSFVIQE